MSYEDLYRAILDDDYERFYELVGEVDLEPPPADADRHLVDAAVWSGDPDLVRALLERGADPDAGVEEGTTPLHTAVREGWTEVARLLVEHGADVDVENHHGQQPLKEAIHNGDYEATKLLVERGADPTHEDEFGNSPLSMLRDRAGGPGDRGPYRKFFELFTDEQLAHEASGTPEPTGLEAGHDRVNLDGDVEEVAEWMWDHLVPPSGQADTVQGELLRAVERLRSEAQRNGNANWGQGYEILLEFLETHLCDPDRFDAETVALTRADLDRLRDHRDPYLDDDLYDRLVERVVAYCERAPELVEKLHDEDLYL